MKVSLNWNRFYNEQYKSAPDPAAGGVDKLVEKIGAQLGAVEEVVNLGRKYEGILVVKVVECQKHPNADKLSLCLVDDGGADKKVKRDKDGLIQIVCGAPNVKAGMSAAWIPPGATVPSTIDKEPFVIEAMPMRNKTSHGMLASPKELDLGDNHEGILALDSGKPGDTLTKNLGLDDYIIDIENKMFTHRPDCFGMLGIARELAGIRRQPFKSPAWYREDASLSADGRKNVLRLKIENSVPELVPRFCALAIKDIKVGPSPAWLQSYLSRVGVRPINNIVDLTNYYMLLTAQPLHAYDYDKVKTGILGARLSKKGERLKLLSGKQITLNDNAVVITDGNRPIGLGGIMGGADTEVDETTKNIILECANFDMNQTRRTAFEYGLFTDAATRFTKNQSPRQNMAVIVKAADDILRICGGRTASPVVDDKHFSDREKSVKTSAQFINSRLGLKLAANEIRRLLENVEFGVKTSGEAIEITPPFWRTDIEIPEDIVEEVGRLYGYDKLPLVLPSRDLAPPQVDKLLAFKSRLRDILVRAGANEVLTHSFVHESLLQKVGQDPTNSFRILNAISPDLQYYRQGLMPSLLDKVHANIKQGYDRFALFEIGKIHFKGLKDDDGLPAEPNHLALVAASKSNPSGTAYYWARQFCDYLFRELNIQVSYHPKTVETSKKVTYYDLLRTAEIMIGSKVVGRIGEFKPSVTAELKLPSYSAGFSLHLDDILDEVQQPQYRPLNRFPALEQDFCLRADASLNYSTLTDFMLKNLAKLSKNRGFDFQLEPLDIFQKTEDKAHKQTTWRIILSNPERTLTTDETNKLLDDLAAIAKQELKAERI